MSGVVFDGYLVARPGLWTPDLRPCCTKSYMAECVQICTYNSCSLCAKYAKGIMSLSIL